MDHRLTKPNLPWTDGQVEGMTLKIKATSFRRSHYYDHAHIRAHPTCLIAAYSFARRTLSGLTKPCAKSEPGRCILDQIHPMPGPSNPPRIATEYFGACSPARSSTLHAHQG